MEKLSELSLWTKWKRPSSVPYPNVWHRFTMKSKDGKTQDVKIIDLTSDRFDESMEFMKNYFYPHEPVTLALKYLEDELSYHNDLCLQRIVLEQNMSIIAVLDEDVPKPEILGLLKLMVATKNDDPPPHIPGVTAQKKSELMKVLRNNFDPFRFFGTDTLIKDFGLCVKSTHRGLNIGYELFGTIEKVAKAFDIKASTTACNSIQSQTIAEKIGYQVINEIVYNEYKDDQGRLVCPVEGTKSVKFMAIEYIHYNR